MKLRTGMLTMVAVVAALLIGATTGCSDGGNKPPAAVPAAAPATKPAAAPQEPGGATPEKSQSQAWLEQYKDVLDVPMVEYKWDPTVGDASVSAELGGPGFTGEGWTSNFKFPALGSAAAVKGGQLTMHIMDWPATLALTGKDYNSSFNYMVKDLSQEGLLTMHSTTLEILPNIATHWQISDDKQDYRFRINPAARWSDGSEITSADVVATWKLMMDEELLFPSNILTFEKYNEPKAESKYIVSVTAKEDNWRNFLYFSTMSLFPAKDIAISGTVFLKQFQNAYPATSGPYFVRVEDIELGQSLQITRRTDWWQKDNPAWTGLYNIDKYKVVVVTDPNLAFEKAKKGELDLFVVSKAQWWAEEVDKVDAVQRGILQKRKLFTDAPIGTAGLAINVKHPVLADLRIRQALQYLLDRDLMIKKLFFNEYASLSSYHQGGTYANLDNEVTPYDPFKAVALLEEAGWTELSPELYRVKDGKELSFKVVYASPLSERFLTMYQESCKKAGIRLELQLLTPAAQWKNLTEKEYELASIQWGGLVFPNPETSFKASLAGQTGNNNVTGFADPRVDELLVAYDRAYDVKERIKIIREIDGIVYRAFPYVLQWYNPAQRFLYSSKFSMPAWGAGRTWDTDSMHYCWWVDPQKEKQVEEAKNDPSKTLPTEEVENHFWQAWNHRREQEAKAAPK